MKVPATPLLFLLALAPLSAQATPHAQDPAPKPAQTSARPPTQTPQPTTTLRAQAKLVVVDIVVTDREHHPVKGLKQSDFALSESNTPQVVRSFDAHQALTAGEAAKFPPVPPLPPGYFTNYTPTPTNSAVNILLLDALNTPLADQQYVRQQLLAYLKTSRPGTNVAIFGLSTRLVMLQGFTSNPEILKAVVNKQGGKSSVLLDDTVGGGGTPNTASDMNADMGGMLPADVVANMQTFMDIQQSFQLSLRAKYTLDAMNALARYLSSIPGRKNLLWFSGSFPLNVLPDVTDGASNPFAGVADSEAEYRETTNLLARAQVAVYPIDARGLMVSPVMSAANSGAKYARNPSALGRDEGKFFNSQAEEHSTMSRMAQDTGGRAFFNTNGLKEAVDKAVEEGSTYYTLAYTPTNAKWKGDFRKIEVKLSAPAPKSGYQLQYRRGYYADDPNSADSPVTTSPAAAAPSVPGSSTAVNRDPKLILKAMSHGVPGSTEILFKVRVLPTTGDNEDTVATGNIANATNAKGPFRRYTIDYAAIPSDISYEITPDGMRHASVEFITLVYQPDGALVNHVTAALNVVLTPAQFARARQGGLAFRQEISVPLKGDYNIRAGIHDLRNNHVGATELNVALVRNLPPVTTLQPTTPPAAAPPAPKP